MIELKKKEISINRDILFNHFWYLFKENNSKFITEQQKIRDFYNRKTAQSSVQIKTNLYAFCSSTLLQLFLPSSSEENNQYKQIFYNVFF